MVRDVLSAIPPEADDREDSVLRRVVEGMADAADLASIRDSSEFTARTRPRD